MKRMPVACLLGVAVSAMSIQAADLWAGEASPEVSIIAPDLRSAQKVQAMAGNSNETLVAAYGALTAYAAETDGPVERTLRDAGWTVERVTTPHAHFIVGKYRGHAETVGMVGIAGTERKIDVSLNLLSDLVPLGNATPGRVHEGYQRIASEVMASPSVRRLLEETPQRVIVTGHSLGGAVANLVGMQWADAGAVTREQLRIITFAAPDMGDAEALRRLGEYPAVNYVMHADIIPNLIHWLGKGYGANPNDVQWDVHTPPIRLPHAMVRFLDEAWYQAALTFPSVLAQQDAADVYVASPAVAERMPMADELQRAYRSTAIRSLRLPRGRRVVREYRPQDWNEALARARALGAQELVWIPLAVYPDKEDPLRTYGLEVTVVRYDLRSDAVRSWESRVLTQGAYTLFPLVHDYVRSVLTEETEESALPL